MADELRFTAVEPNATVIFTKQGSPTAYSFKYRTDLNTEWQDYTLNTTLTIPSVGGWIEFKNITIKTYGAAGYLSDTSSAYYRFVLNGPKVAASGKVASMLTRSSRGAITSVAQYTFYGLFGTCTSLTTAPQLPDASMALAPQCYYGMFKGCTSLTAAPELPATTLASYCYQSMFSGCKALKTAPELPATTLDSNCYQSMFFGCTSLTKAPELPATTLASYCYQSMFSGCTALTTAPGLPATTLASYCYREMFKNCTSLTTAPELPATTLDSNCYQSMFYGCTRLNKIVYKGSGLSYTSNWLAGVSSTGTFYYTDQNLDVNAISRDASGIPADWTIQYLAPKPSLVFSINGRAVASLTINGKAVAKLGA